MFRKCFGSVLFFLLFTFASVKIALKCFAFRYQIYDSLQAFSSSIAGLLASRAVLEGASHS